MSAAVLAAAFHAANALLTPERTHERCFAIAGLSLRLRFADPFFATLLDPAFAHLAPAAGPFDLDVVLLAGPVPADATALCDDYGDGGLTLLDFAHGRSLWCARDLAQIPAWAAASPLRTLLARFFATRGRFLVHGAAIGNDSGAVLLGAKGGSGKSTSALACLDAGGALRVAGDDFVVLEPDATAPRVHSLLATAKIGRAHVSLLPTLERFVARDGGPLDNVGEKAVLRLHPGANLALTLSVTAIAVPALALHRPESLIEPISRGEALRALAPSSIFLVPCAGAETLDALRALVAACPAYRLWVGSDVRGIPSAIEAIIATAARRERVHA